MRQWANTGKMLLSLTNWEVLPFPRGCQRWVYSNNICRAEAPLAITGPAEAGIRFLGPLKCRWGLLLRKLLLLFLFLVCCAFIKRDVMTAFQGALRRIESIASRTPRCWLQLIHSRAVTSAGHLTFRRSLLRFVFQESTSRAAFRPPD